jgi:hypothetical protein
MGNKGGGLKLGLHVVPHTHWRAAAYTRSLGCDLNSKFFFLYIQVTLMKRVKVNVT